MSIDIIIPTCKDKKEFKALEREIFNNSTGDFRLIISSSPLSASKNRNAGLDRSNAEYVIMIDDDIVGLYKGWNEDLIRELKRDESVSMVSARLIKENGDPAMMMSDNYDLKTPTIEVKKIPTACIAFRKTKLRFDESFKGSGFEDDDFCARMGGKFITDNRVKIIHKNEMKNQKENWDYNLAYLERKHGGRPL